MRNTRTLILALAVFSVIFVLGELFFVPKTYVTSAVVQALQAPRTFLGALADQHGLISQLRDAQLESQSLRAQLIAAQNRPGIVKEHGVGYLRAAVYSEYPLNNAGMVLIAAGTDEGVAPGMVVVAAPGVFLGEVTKSYAHQSEVRTLYDPGWELPVKIGSGKVDSLMVGGHEPRLTLISKKKQTAVDTDVYLAAQKYSYGLLVGKVGDLVDSDKNLFQEAPLALPYLIGDLNEVYVTISD